ncbi:type III secretion system apparatus protein YscQ/HrcQ [Burkholderia pseudomallei]|nr:type III secretion system apparatus protein YscQ/HrcQ [Burkholderia pseudomallei]
MTVGALRAVPAAALDATRCMLSFALDGAPLRCALLDAQAPWLDALAARLRDERRRDAASGLARVRLPGRVRLGTRALPLAVLRSLRPGDVLLDMVPAALGAARPTTHAADPPARRAAGIGRQVARDDRLVEVVGGVWHFGHRHRGSLDQNGCVPLGRAPRGRVRCMRGGARGARPNGTQPF